jgi:hypothetical protein
MNLRSFALPALAFTLLTSVAQAQPPAKPARAIVLHAAHLLDVVSGHIMSPGEVLVEGERITAVGSSVQHPAVRN